MANAPVAPSATVGTTPWPRPSGPAPEPSPQAVPALRLPSEVHRRGTMLLNQQFWLWGQDIRRAEGNLLIEHGFVAERPAAGVRGSTRYEVALGGGRVVVLWGFGLFYGDPERGGLYLGRFRLAPRLGGWDPARGVWEPSRLPRFAPPGAGDDWRRTGDLLVPALAWIGRYKAWIATAFGTEYRRRCLAPWPRPVCGAAETASHWGRLSHRCGGAVRRAARGGRFETEQTGRSG